MTRQNFDLGEQAKALLVAEAAARFGGNQSETVRVAITRLAAHTDLADLPETTREQIQALILDLDMDARDVVVLAIAQLHQREVGEPERDVLAELDELKARVDELDEARRRA